MKGLSLPTFLLSLSFAAGIVDALVARTIQERSLTDALAHGNYGNSGDEVWRYQEAGDGLFVGVKPEEWDDSVHKRGVDPHELDNLQSPAVPIADEHNLFDRDLRGKCTAQLRCVSDMASKVKVTILGAVTPFINKLRERYGESIVTHMNRPVWANFYGVGGQNFIVTGIFLGLERWSRPEQCSTKNTQADLLLSLVELVDNNNVNAGALEVNLKLPSGKTATLSLAVKHDDQEPANNCHAPKAPAS